MRGGVNLFRPPGNVARLFVEVGHSRSERSCLGDTDAVAEFAALNGAGEVVAERALSVDEYEAWVDWIDPLTGQTMGRPKRAGAARQGSPRFADLGINVSQELSQLAAEHPEVAVAIDRAQQRTLVGLRRWFAQRAVTRIGPQGAQRQVPVELLQVVGIAHAVSRAGRPYRHLHMQFGTRVRAEGGWRGLDNGVLFSLQAEFRRIGGDILRADRELIDTLAGFGVSADAITRSNAQGVGARTPRSPGANARLG